jgi:hypothetical protein
MRRKRITLPRASDLPWYARWQQHGTIERWRMLTQLMRDEQKTRNRRPLTDMKQHSPAFYNYCQSMGGMSDS